MGRKKKEKPMSIENELESVQQELDIARKELEQAKADIETKKQELKVFGTREHDAKELEISAKQVTMGNNRASLAAKIANQKAYDSVPVTGKFINQRAPGQPVKLTYCKYDSDPVKWTLFEHNRVYTIPRGFADQINEYYARITYNQKRDNIIVDPTSPGTALESEPVRHQIYAFVPTQWAA